MQHRERTQNRIGTSVVARWASVVGFTMAGLAHADAPAGCRIEGADSDSFVGMTYPCEGLLVISQADFDRVGSQYRAGEHSDYLELRGDGSFEVQILVDGQLESFPANRWYTGNITNMSEYFRAFDRAKNPVELGNIGGWDTSNVTNMQGMFKSTKEFNHDISGWDVSQVTDTSHMFYNARNFNQYLGNWDVGQVTNMQYMFAGADRFNQDIGSWDVGQVLDMRSMFFSTEDFNKPIGGWDVSQVTDMSAMFSHAEAFDQDLGDWDVRQVVDMSSMFYAAKSFNQDMGDWDVSQVTDMSVMFSYTGAFDQDLGGWDVSQVTDMSAMFAYAGAFDQDLGNWDVRQVVDMNEMFKETSVFNGDLSDWDVGQVRNFSTMFYDAKAFNQDIGDWDVRNAANMERMFQGASSFNQDLSGWSIAQFDSKPYFFDLNANREWVSNNRYQPLWAGAELLPLPNLQGVYPQTGAEVWFNTDLWLTFDMPVKLGEGQITLYEASSQVFEVLDVNDPDLVRVIDSPDGNHDDDGVRLRPSKTLENGTSYYITVSETAIENRVAQNSDLAYYPGFSGDQVWNFAILDPVASSSTSRVDVEEDTIYVGDSATVRFLLRDEDDAPIPGVADQIEAEVSNGASISEFRETDTGVYTAQVEVAESGTTKIEVGFGDISLTTKLTATPRGSPGIRISERHFKLEEGTEAVFTVALESAPFDDVTLTLVPNQSQVIGLSATELTFTPQTWNLAQEVRISALDDDKAAPSHARVVVDISSNGSADPDYAEVENGWVSIMVTDDETAALVLDVDSLLIYQGKSASFSVALSARPSDHKVEVELTPRDSNAVTLDKSLLTFDTESWDQAQTVTLTAAVDDSQAELDTHIDLVGKGGAFYGETATLALTILSVDDVAPSVTALSPPNGASGVDATGALVMTFDEPVQAGAGNFGVYATETGTLLTSIAATDRSVAFDSAVVTIALPDDTLDAGVLYSVTVDDQAIQDVTGGHAFAGFESKDVWQFTTGGDLSVRASRVEADPSADVLLTQTSTVRVTLYDEAETLLIGRADQIAGVATNGASVGAFAEVSDGVYEALVAATTVGTVQITVSVDGVTLDQSPSLSFVEEETPAEPESPPAVQVSETALALDEGTEAGVTVALATAPYADVKVTLVSDAGDVLDLSATELTFTPNNWNLAQEVRIQALDNDALGSSAETATLSLSLIDSVDRDYAGLNDYTIGVTVYDDEAAALVLDVDSVRMQQGHSKTVSVALSAQPSDAVEIALSPRDSAALTLDKTVLTFQPTAWDQAQVVTLTAAAGNSDVLVETHLDLEATGPVFWDLNTAVPVTIVTDDAAAPTLLELFPPNGATGVDPNGELVMTFDEPVEAGAGEFRIYRTHVGGFVTSLAATDSAVEFDGAVVTLRLPEGALYAGALYNITVGSNAIQDVTAGNSFAGFDDRDDWQIYTGGGVSAHDSTLQASSSIDVPLTQTPTLRVSLYDTAETPLIGRADQIAATVSDGGSVGTFVEVSDGVYEAPVTATTVGTVQVTVSVDGVRLDQSLSLSFIEDEEASAESESNLDDGAEPEAGADENAGSEAGTDESGQLEDTLDASAEDTVAPTLTLSTTAPAAGVSGLFSVTAAFSEVVDGLAMGQIEVSHGAVEEGSLTSADAQTFTFSVTPDGGGHVTLVVLSGAAHDSAGNQNLESDRLTVFYLAEEADTAEAEDTGALVSSMATSGVMGTQMGNAINDAVAGGIGGGSGSLGAVAGGSYDGSQGSYDPEAYNRLHVLSARQSDTGFTLVDWFSVGLSQASLDAELAGDGSFAYALIGKELTKTRGGVSGVLYGAETSSWDYEDETDVDRTGFSVGYYTARQSGGLTFSGSAIWTLSLNDFVSNSGATGDAQSSRWIFKGGVSGERAMGRRGAKLKPYMDLMYATETLGAFDFSDGTSSQESTANLGRLGLGLEYATAPSASGSRLLVRGELSQVFGSDDITLSDGTVYSPNEDAVGSVTFGWLTRPGTDTTAQIELTFGELGNDEAEEVRLDGTVDRKF